MTVQTSQASVDAHAAVQRILGERGPLSQERLLTELAECGVDLGDDPETALDDLTLSDDLGPVVSLLDGRWVWLPQLADGRLLTHRVTREEVEHDLLHVVPDFAPARVLDEESGEGLRLADGARVDEVVSLFDDEKLDERGIPSDAVAPDGSLLLPAGRLHAAGVHEGELVGLRFDAGGIALFRADEPDPQITDEAAGRLAAVFELPDREETPAYLDQVVWTACADDPAVFRRALPPLGELLEQAGLQRDGEDVAPAGFDFARWRAGQRIERISSTHDLDEDEALTVLALATQYEQITRLLSAAVEAEEAGTFADFAGEVLQEDPAGEPSDPQVADARETIRELLPMLAEPAVAEALLFETAGDDRSRAAALGMFAETLEPMAPRVARPALRWLRGKAHELLGEIPDAEVAFGAAEELDPHWEPALWELARCAADRGEAERGLSLLRRAGVEEDDDLATLLAGFQAAPAADLGRNQSCWCGSGRKYKQCHLNRAFRPPLAARAEWLYGKAVLDARYGPERTMLMTLIQERAQSPADALALISALADPLVVDVALFEGGVFGRFLQNRGMLLPEDERLLGQEWLESRRGLYEVASVRKGRTMTLRDVRSGSEHDVPAPKHAPDPGELVCARILPVGEDVLCPAGVEPVPPERQEELLTLLDEERGAADLVRLLPSRNR